MRSSILDFLLLILGVSLDSTSDGVHKSPRDSEILSDECLKLDPGQNSHFFALDGPCADASRN